MQRFIGNVCWEHWKNSRQNKPEWVIERNFPLWNEPIISHGMHILWGLPCSPHSGARTIIHKLVLVSSTQKTKWFRLAIMACRQAAMMTWCGFLDTKYAYVCHAELNAILNRNAASLQGCRLYVSLFPCNECAKAIIQSGIREVIYMDNKYADTESTKASVQMFRLAGVTCREYQPMQKEITLSL